MQVRSYKESDLSALKTIHATQGFAYEFPDLGHPLFLSKLVLVDDENAGREAPHKENAAGPSQEILGAALLRLTAEAYLLLDPRKGTPRERWRSLMALHEATRTEAWARGLEDVHAWLPPQIAAKFGRRLTRLGWIRDDAWTPYCKRLG